MLSPSTTYVIGNEWVQFTPQITLDSYAMRSNLARYFQRRQASRIMLLNVDGDHCLVEGVRSLIKYDHAVCIDLSEMKSSDPQVATTTSVVSFFFS
jgi:hypothetical protein